MHATLLALVRSFLYKLWQKCYETKQYKKGIKHCEAIFKKFPDHGGTGSLEPKSMLLDGFLQSLSRAGLCQGQSRGKQLRDGDGSLKV